MIVVQVDQAQRRTILVGDAAYVDLELVYALTRKDVSTVKNGR